MRFPYFKSLLVLALLLILLGCSNSDKYSRPFTYRLAGEPTTLNPALITDVPSDTVASLIFSGLFKVTPKMELEPDLVESYEISDNGQVLTFKLKENIKWHDGEPLTVDDVLFTFAKILDPKTQTVRQSSFIVDGKPILFRKKSEFEFQAILPKPFAPVLSKLSMGILPKHLLEDENINTATFNHAPVGTGPFRFKKWESGQYIVLEKNPSYFGDTPKLDQVVFKIIPDTNTALIALQKKEIDVCSIPPKELETFSNSPYIQVYEFPQLAYYYMSFNLKNPFFEDDRVRQAITLAVDKNQMIASVFKGHALRVDVPSSPASWAYPPKSLIREWAYDPEASKALLADAGFVLNPKTNIQEKEGRPLAFTLILRKGSTEGHQVSQMIQQYLSAVGIKMDIQIMEWKTLLKINNDPKHDFDSILLGWSLGIDPDAYSTFHSSQYPTGFNTIAYSNPIVDSLLVEGREELDEEARKSIYHELFSLIGQDLPYLFLYSPNEIIGINKRVKGLSEPGPAGLLNPIEPIYISND